MTTPGALTRAEIASQPQVWRSVLTRPRQAAPLDEAHRVVFTGCGSTYYLAMWAARVAQRRSATPTVAAPASELLYHADSWLSGDTPTTLVALSRSGETTETLRAVERLRDRLVSVHAVTCATGNTLADLADSSVVLDEAAERSLVQTRSFTSMLLVAATLAMGGPPQPEEIDALVTGARELFDEHGTAFERLATDKSIERIFFLGGDSRYGLASEAMLKVKEMALAHAEAYHPLEFRHGPMSLVDERSLVVGLVNPENEGPEVAVLDDMRGLGGRVVALGTTRPSEAELAVPLPQVAAPWRDVLYLPLLQSFGCERAIHRGLDPDDPANLDAVVRLDDET